MFEVRHGDCLEVMAEMPSESVEAVVTDPPYGLGFMGKEWDSLPPGREWAEACLRVLKPGGHLLAFGSTRTYHRLAVAIEDGGFDIRDSLIWLYSSGFPKSHDVSKGLDRLAGAERPVVGYTNPHDPRTAMARKMYGTDLQDEPGKGIPITEAATEEAKRWEGFGTALKPSYEPVVMARRPLTATVAEAIRDYGTGALNIDGCRITLDPDEVEPGRWPANLMMNEAAAEMVDADNPEVRPSRYFYCPKSNQRERSAGLDAANPHPTVKPIDLMRYLCRLVTPPGGTVLDPFAGSGSTGIAAGLEGFDFIGIDNEADFITLATARLEWWSDKTGETSEIIADVKPPEKRDEEGMTLF